MVKLKESTAEIQAVQQEFMNALQAMFEGDTALMSQVWSHADDVSYLGPQGDILVGWDKVLKAWKEQAKLLLRGSLKAENMHLSRDGDIGIVQCNEVGSNIVNGKSESVRIRATNIFRKENGSWKMISHHTDRLSHLSS